MYGISLKKMWRRQTRQRWYSNKPLHLLKTFAIVYAIDPPVFYATDRSKAVVPVLFLILCSFVVYTKGRLMFKSLLVLFVLIFLFVLAF